MVVGYPEDGERYSEGKPNTIPGLVRTPFGAYSRRWMIVARANCGGACRSP
jgi:hypothetical protein